MSLALNTTTAEGIVLATDSRQSYRNSKGMARIGSDNASKLFEVNKRVGVAVTGLAFLPEGGVPKNISKYIDEFRRAEGVKDLDVKEIAERLHKLFDETYNYREQLNNLPQQIKNDLQNKGCEVLDIQEHQSVVKFRFKNPQGKIHEQTSGVEPINLLVAGYNKDGSHEVNICYIPGEIQQKRNSKEKGKEYGASWIGQTDVVSRIVLGFDPRIGSSQLIGQVAQKFGAEKVNQELRGLEYVIQWGTMTLQDAIDFCTLMIETTSAIQRFSDGIQANPGDMPGVGGEVDVAVITPDKGLVWVNKKNLSISGSSIDLDKLPDISD